MGASLYILMVEWISSFSLVHKCQNINKLDGVAPLVAEPPRCNTTTRQTLPNPVKRLNQCSNFKTLQDLECLKAVQHSPFNSCLCYLSLFRRGGAVKTAKGRVKKKGKLSTFCG